MLQRKYRWQLLMPATINDTLGILVSQFCQEIRFGDYSFNQLNSIKYGAYQKFYAGFLNIDKLTLTFLQSVENSVLDYFYGWSELIIDKNGFYYPKNNYKKTIYISLYDRTGIESVKFELSGVFPTNKPTIALAYGDDGVQKIAITLSVDKIKMTSLIGSARRLVTGAMGDVAGGLKESIFGGK
jgi:hypothetical protein